MIAPEVRVIVPLTPVASIVSPGPAAAIAARNDPAPESLRFVTVYVAAHAGAEHPSAPPTTGTATTPRAQAPP
ncbi:MAG: hypothetical protein ABSH51_10740 [Solirubrobacteraceae bacterium]